MIERRWPLHPMKRVANENHERSSLAYRALVLFSLIYFVRPEDFVPGLTFLPLGKIAGGIALLALISSVTHNRPRLPIELKVLLLLFADLLLCIPFAVWRFGAFDTVISKFSKGVIVAILIYLVAISVSEVRRLLAIQAGTVALLTMASVFVHHTQDGRLIGIQKGILENPNDLAMNIAINLPLCVAFLFATKKLSRKLFWAVSLVVMSWGVIATYSRSGLVAMVATTIICIWEFGIRGKRPMVLGIAVLTGLIAIGVTLATPHYLIRIESMVLGDVEDSGDRGSKEARQELLRDSLTIMAKHPVLGIGPGNFPSYTQSWRVVHNSYAEFGAETGLPGILLFVLLLGLTIRKIRRVRKLPGYESSKEIRLWTSALRAAMAAYMIGAFFASTEYELFPYFMVGYVCAVYRIASVPQSPCQDGADNGDGGKLGDRAKRQRELVWAR